MSFFWFLFQFYFIIYFNSILAKSNQSHKQSDQTDTGSSSCASLPPSSHLKPPSKMIPASRSNIHSIAGSANRPGTGKHQSDNSDKY